MVKPDPSRVADELAIRAVLANYCRGVDRKDWELVRSCYHPGAIDDHGAFAGPVDEFIAWVAGRHEHMVRSAHFIGNVVIEFAGDRAFVETYALNWSESRPPGGEPIFVEGSCRYVDRFECRDGDWRIAARQVVLETTWPARQPLPPAAGFDLGSRDPDDASWRIRSEVLGGE